jgi:hypothetical protein
MKIRVLQEITKKSKGESQIILESSLVTSGGEKEEEKSPIRAKKQSKGFMPRVPELSGEETGLVQ